uniref:Transmembrane protein 126A n=1 Tax=Salvator merianae TaxID=96440 RepID=A0A8D0BZF8_SALMN
MAGEIPRLDQQKQLKIAKSQSEILREQFEKLPEADRSIFQNGSLFLALNASLCSLIANGMLRQVLNITEARIAASLPVVVLPFISTVAVFESYVNLPLMNGELNCATCAWMRGSLIGAVIGCLYPAFLTFPLNGALAARYSTTPLPSKENALRYWVNISKPIFRKMRIPAILQAAFGAYLGSKNHETYIKMLRVSGFGRRSEELSE